MNKPMMVARQEFSEKLVELVNGSGVPLAVAEPILADILSLVRQSMQEQYEKEKKEWDEAQKEAQKEAEKKPEKATPTEV